MQISVHQSKIGGITAAPSSKSYTIRGLMCAALAEGTSELSHPLVSDDTGAALMVLEKIGVKNRIQSGRWQIEGGRLRAPDGDLYCGESAATLRFMSAICSLIPGTCRLTAGPTLRTRPVKVLIEALKTWGVDISRGADDFQLIINGGKLKGGQTELPGNISSQYVSALLLAAPRAEQRTLIKLTAPLESRPYVLMTLECLKQFGIETCISEDLMKFETYPQRYRPVKYEVEGDWSSASYLLGLGAAAGEITVNNLNSQSLQGDKQIAAILKEMGARVRIDENSVTVSQEQLKAIKIDLNDCIDLLPTVAALAALAKGTSELSGIRRARLKESNRIAAVKNGLESLGIRVVEEPDKVIITGGEIRKAVIDSYTDHRIAMAFSIIGAARGTVTLKGAECVSKTYPDYWQILRRLGVKSDEQ
jgi:3-phosphoshikimate 1-carboxyvinyltransferase